MPSEPKKFDPLVEAKLEKPPETKPPITSGRDLDWGAVENAARTILKQSEDAQYIPPEDVQFHQMRVRKVCIEMNKITEALQLRFRDKDSDRMTNEVRSFLKVGDTVRLTAKACADLRWPRFARNQTMRVTRIDPENMTDDVPSYVIEVDDPEVNQLFCIDRMFEKVGI